jgi:hypothetical protein
MPAWHAPDELFLGRAKSSKVLNLLFRTKGKRDKYIYKYD